MNIPYGRQTITNEDVEAVSNILQADFLTQGPEILKFEKIFAEFIGSKYAVAVANGTAALHLCAIALNVKSGSKVITTPISFVASANCVKYCGGDVVFADIDPETYLLDISKVEKLLESHPTGTFSGIIPVDFAGQPLNLEDFRTLADKHGLWIIEDACHAPGGYFKDSKNIEQYCGNGQFADLAIFSFHPVKHIATGEGGMITTNNKELYEKLLLLRSHGITKDELSFESTEPGQEKPETYPGWYYEMQTLGYNYRLTDIQAALGISQLKRAKQGFEKRKEIAEKYDKAFEGSNILTPKQNKENQHAWHLYVILIDKRKELYDFFRSNGIFAQVHYIPVHLQPFYRNLGWKKGDFPISEKYYEKCISLPMYPALTTNQQDYVINKVLEFVK